MKRLALFVVGVLIGCVLFVAIAHASPRRAYTRMVTYHTHQHTRIDTLHIVRKCIRTEDGAAHLHLIDYGNGSAALSCRY